MRNRGRALVILLVQSCFVVAAVSQENAAQRQGEAELLVLHQADRRAHFAHDIDALLGPGAGTVIDVRDGKVTAVTPAEKRAKFAEYFRHADFTAWDDVAPPIVRVSRDGSMGWMVVRVHIAYTDHDGAGKTTAHDETMAWLAAYEKRDGKWFMTAVTSTSDAH